MPRFLSPAPLYHVAPHAGIAFAIHLGGTAIIMEHFDADRALSLQNLASRAGVDRGSVLLAVYTAFRGPINVTEPARTHHLSATGDGKSNPLPATVGPIVRISFPKHRTLHVGNRVAAGEGPPTAYRPYREHPAQLGCFADDLQETRYIEGA
jgi:hypothetical protein